MPKVTINLASFERMLESLQAMKEDCGEEEVEKVSAVALTLFQQDPSFIRLKAVQSALNEKVEALSSTEHSNLASLAEKVNTLVKELQKKAAISLAKDFKELKSLPGMGLDLSTVLSIARECMRINPEATLEDLHHFPLFNTPEGRKGFTDLLKPYAKRQGGLVIRFIQRSILLSDAEDKSSVLELLKTCIVFDEDIIMSFFLGQIVDGLTNKQFCDLILDVNYANAERAIYLFCHFSTARDIPNATRVRIASAIADHEPEQLLMGLDYFGIEDWERLPKLAIKLAKAAPKKFLRHFKKIHVYPEDIQFRIALACSLGAPDETIANLDKFKIEKELSLFYLLKNCAAHGWCAGDDVVFKKFKVLGEQQKEDIIIASIINHHMVAISELDKAKLSLETTQKLILMALTHNYLHNNLEGEDLGKFTEYVPPKLEALSDRTLGEKGEKYAKLLKLTDDRSKVIALLAIEVLKFSIEEARIRKVIQKICRCGSGAQACSLLRIMNELQKAGTLELYLDYITDSKGTVDEALIVPALFGVRWLSAGQYHLLGELKMVLSSAPKVRKKLAENGPTLRIAIEALLHMNNIQFEVYFHETFLIMCLAICHADEAHFSERQSAIETLYSSSKPELLKALLPEGAGGKRIREAMQELNELKDRLFPLDRQVLEKQEEVETLLLPHREAIKKASDLRNEAEELLKKVKLLEQRERELSQELALVEKKPLAGDISASEVIEESAPLEAEIEALLIKIQDLKKEAQSKKAQAKALGLSEIEKRESKLKKELKALEKASREAKKTKEAKEKIRIIQAKEDDIQQLITESFKEAVKSILLSDETLRPHLEGIGDLDKKFVETLGSMRSPNGWKIYQIAILKLMSISLNKALNDFILGYLKGTLRKERYQDNCPHNHHMIERCPKIWEAWSSKDKGREVEIMEKTYHILNTDDPQDLFLSGTDIEGSCQNIRGAVDYNKCLLAYTNDGRNRMIAIKDPVTGKIKARAIIRLLWHKELQRPVLHLELVYPKEHLPVEFQSHIYNYAIEQAKRLECPLYCSSTHPDIANPGSTKEVKQQSLVSMKGRAPFEYVDAASGVTENGEYEIVKLNLFRATEEFLS